MLDEILDSPYHASIEASLVLIILIFLEAVLSADNAIALAAIAQGLEAVSYTHLTLPTIHSV